jgi:hypothetical protein
VRARLDQFIEAGSWHDVETEPLALFDLVLDGLFREVDTAVWRLLDEIAGLERVSFPSATRIFLVVVVRAETLTTQSSGSSKPRMLEAVHSEQPTRSTSPNCTVGPRISSTWARRLIRASWW